MIKYAFARDMLGEHSKWTLTPWRSRGLQEFARVADVPADYILIASHYAPWWEPLSGWIAQGRSYIEIEYGYWGPDTPRRETRRVTYNGHHNLNIQTVPYSRSHLFPAPKHQPWKTTPGEYILAIQSKEIVLTERTGEIMEEFRQRIVKSISPYWNGPVKWRKKMGAKFARFDTFQQQVAGAYAVVGERTMACVESCLLGTPAYTVDPSMTTLLMGGIKNLANPTYPDRNAWWEHICWSQFNQVEFGTTVPCDLVEQYQILSR